jgi:hypothetical protein
MRVRMHMRDCLADLDIFGCILQGESWFGWRVLLIAAAGEELTDDERAEFKRLTGRDREPGRFCRELIVAAGRRAGKTQALICFAVWIAVFCDYRGVLAPGETGTVLIVSQTQHWSREILNRAEGVFLHGDPHKSPLPSMIVRRTADSIDLNNGIRLEVRPASFRTLRGPTYVAVIADEIAFWYTSVDYANPDTEILAAVRPGLLTTHGPLLMASSVYAKTGVLYDSYKRYFGPAGPPDILVAHASSRDLNPSISQAEIDLALERDPVANRAEYLSEWRSDVEGFIPRDIVEFCVRNYIELPPQANTNYVCFIDQATGVPKGDSFVAVVAHLAGDRVTVDAVREVRPPFNFFEAVGTVLLPLCKAYHIYKVVGDNYAGELAKEPVRKAGISFELAEKHKTQLYADPFLGLLNAGKIDLPRYERAINQICSLERSVQRSGRDQITHPTHGHDDIANAIAGAVDLAYSHTGYDRFYKGWCDDPAPQQQQPLEPPRCNGDWWRSMPRSQASTGGANERLREFYRGLDNAFRWGIFR